MRVEDRKISRREFLKFGVATVAGVGAASVGLGKGEACPNPTETPKPTEVIPTPTEVIPTPTEVIPTPTEVIPTPTEVITPTPTPTPTRAEVTPTVTGTVQATSTETPVSTNTATPPPENVSEETPVPTPGVIFAGKSGKVSVWNRVKNIGAGLLTGLGVYAGITAVEKVMEGEKKGRN